MSTRPLKIILYLLAFVVLLGGGAAIANVVIGRADARIAAAEAQVKKLQKERDDAKAAQKVAEQHETDAKAQAADWQKKATAQRQRADKAEARIRDLEGQIAQQGAIQAPTDPSTLPAAAAPLAAGLTSAGVPAKAEGTKVAMEEPAAQKALALVQDGQRYPQVVAIAHLQAEEITALKTQADDLRGAFDSLTIAKAHSDEALSACDTAKEQLTIQLHAADGQIVQLHEEVKAEKTKVRAEAAKKWMWGGIGAGGTALLFLIF